MYSLCYVNRIVLAMFFMSGGDVAKLFLFGICALNYCGIKTEASFNRKIVFLHKLYLDF